MVLLGSGGLAGESSGRRRRARISALQRNRCPGPARCRLGSKSLPQACSVPPGLEIDAAGLLGAACALEIDAAGRLGAACALEIDASGLLGAACALEIDATKPARCLLSVKIHAPGLLGAPVRSKSVPLGLFGVF